MPHRNEFNSNLRLDTVVASQPELGPFIPDGGRGWIILIASFILQIFIPSILSSYGILMLYSRVEISGLNDQPHLWDIALLPTPIVYVAFRTLSDPWSRTIVASSTWPRLVTTSGIFLLCAGLLIQWVAMRESVNIFVYMIAGAFTGFGSSLALTQAETLLSQYFRLKLARVMNLLTCGHSLGFIIVPIALGFLLFKNGILHSLLIYHAVILHCALIVLVFKKPDYLKATRRRYELLQNASEDDEMIFAKDEPVLQRDVNAPSTSNTQPSSSNIETTTTSNNATNQKEKNAVLLTESFAAEFASDLDRNVLTENAPRELYTEVEMTTGNTMYTFDNNIATVDDNSVSIPALTVNRAVTTTCCEEISILRKLSFYKSLFLLITEKYSMLIFWMLFPTYLYTDMPILKVQQTTFLVGAMGLGSLFVGLFSSFLPVVGKNKQPVAAIFSFISAAGYFIISDAGTEGWLLFAALNITICITTHSVLYPSIIKQIQGADSDKTHTLLHTLAGISVLLLLVQDASYKNCFRIMALLQLKSCFLLCLNYLFVHFKRLFTR